MCRCDNWTFEFFRKKLETIEQLLIDIKTQGEKTMAQIDDLNAAIAAEDVDISDIAASATKIGADVTALLAKITAGTPPTDLTAQITAINAHVAALKTASDQLNAADTAANPTPPAA